MTQSGLSYKVTLQSNDNLSDIIHIRKNRDYKKIDEIHLCTVADFAK